MKKILAMLLALTMVLAAFGAMAEAIDPATIEDTMTSENGQYEVAFVTDVGQLMDKSFNQFTWYGVKAFAAENGLTYKYYQPANGSEATDTDRYDAMKAACDAGAKAVVCAGYMQGTALEQVAKDYPEVAFIFIDGWAMGLDNVAGIAYKEEQSGYLAGYAVVKEGFTKLGFCGGGGGTNPACCRYGYGFAQGANAAAGELGIKVDLKYTWLYAANFAASPEMQTMVDGWYSNGTEIVFACGGPIFDNITAAANDNDAKVIGVDVDQSYDSATVVTSALKGLTASTKLALGKVYDGTFAEIANQNVSLGAADDSVGLPTDTWSLENYTVEEYEAQLAAIKAGELVVDNGEGKDISMGNIVNLGLDSLNIDYVD